MGLPDVGKVLLQHHLLGGLWRPYGARCGRCIGGDIRLAVGRRAEVRVHLVHAMHGVDLAFLGQCHVGCGLGLLGLDVGLGVCLCGCPRLLLDLCLLLLVLLHALQQLVFVLERGRRNEHVAGNQSRLHRRQLHEGGEFFLLLRRRAWPFLDRDVDVQVGDLVVDADHLLQPGITGTICMRFITMARC